MNMKVKKFTLVEIMMAVMISTIIVAALGSVTFSVSKSYAVAERKSARLKEYCKIDRLVDNLFRNAVPFGWVDRENNLQKLYFIGDENYLLVSSKQPIFDTDDTGFIFSEFFVQDSCLKIRYKSTPFLNLKNFSANNSSDGNVEVILENIEDIEFKYAKFEKNQVIWSNDFIEQQTAGNEEELYDESLPVAIQISIKWTNGIVKHWLRRTAGASRYSNWGRSDLNPITGKKLKILNDNKL
ncbi:hypothetical protein AAEX28_15820 [Lentisphaerota bacterium WC36G]|nr:hypothetical protein LJT99_02580 [Lentisphaerae bacterium WC36]